MTDKNETNSRKAFIARALRAAHVAYTWCSLAWKLIPEELKALLAGLVQ